jgi:hypothetical protein
LTIRGATILQGGRRKAYRPLAFDERVAAIEAGLAAYRRGDFFEAHELLEPAWMGTDHLAEREFVQGLIKLAAAYVHGVRGNPAGIEKNLRGARARLAASLEPDGTGPVPTLPASDAPAAGLPGPLAAVDRRTLLTAIDERIVELEAGRAPGPAPLLTNSGVER